MSYEERVNGAIFDADAAVKSPCANVSLGRVVSALHAVEIARAADAEVYNLRTNLAAETKRADDAEAEVSGWVKSFEVYHDAEMRARKLWQEANNEPMVWPDKARMTICLLERAQAAEAQRDKLVELLRECFHDGLESYWLRDRVEDALAEMEGNK